MTCLLARSRPALSLLAKAKLFWALWPTVASEMGNSHGAWLNRLVRTGPIHAFATRLGDLTPPFLYLLALASLCHGWITTASLGTAAAVGCLAASVGRLLRALNVARPWMLAAIVPVLPGVAIDASLMASGDALWATPCVLALAAAVERRSAAMLAWCGVALAVNQESLCLAPFMLGMVIARRVPVRWWAAFPAGYLAMFGATWLAGVPLAGAIGIHAGQAGSNQLVPDNAPNVWAAIEAIPGVTDVPLTGLALAAAVGASAWLAARVTTLRLEPATFAAAALLSPLLVVGLLPRMHGRYFFLADVLALVWAAVAGTRAAAHDAALVQAGSTLGILAYVSGESGLALLGAVPMIWVTVRVGRTLFPRRAANDNLVTAGYSPRAAWLPATGD